MSRQPPPPMSPTALVAIAASMTAVMPLAIDIYLIVMPAIARDLGASLAEAQATMAAFALGFGLAQLVLGAAADRYGRRPVALAGALGFVVTSVAIVAAQDLGMLSLGRFAQGFFVATCPILARTVIRDSVRPAETARIYALTNGVAAMGPVLAPFLGAALASIGSWRTALGAIAVYAAILLAVLIVRLPETRPAHEPGTATTPLSAARRILTNRSFQLGAGASVLIYSALFTWLTTSPFLMMEGLGYSQQAAALVLGGGSAGYMTASLASARLAARFRPEQMILAGALLMLAGSLTAFVTATTSGLHPLLMLLALLPFYLGIGLAHSSAMQVVMRSFSSIAGQASAWLGLLQQLGAVAISMTAVRLGAGLAAIATMMLCCLLLLATAIVLQRAAPAPSKAH